MSGVVSDPFATAELRARVLGGWAASPSRFREDANAEEDYALGGYRDRVVVELAQNAADAAARAGVPGRLRLTLRDGTLTAANTGAPLDAAGVEALSTLRASSKRAGLADGETVGRFGVGFAAVVAVSDCPRIRSSSGTVSWSRERTRELVAGIPTLSGELAARSGHVPVLRLPFADAGDGDASPAGPENASPDNASPDNASPDNGFVTVVELPLRDAGAVSLVSRLLEQAGAALLLALPALAEVIIEVGGKTRVLSAAHRDGLSTIAEDGVPSVWRVAAAGGTIDSRLIATRPAEERVRTSWSVRWAVPVTADGTPAGRLPAGTAPVIHAPTPTDEPLGLPALLLASFPLSPDRRHVAPGPSTDFLIERAAVLYAGLLTVLPPGPGLLDLVPGPVGRGELDAQLGQAIAGRLSNLPFLPPAGTGGGRVRPRDALLLDSGLSGPGSDGLAGWLSPVLPNLVAGPVRHPAWAVLGVRRMPLGELADLLAALDREPAWWYGLYAALAEVPADQRAELGALPVPLADGRQARGPRGLLLPGSGLADPAGLAVLGLRIVHPEAAHPLLARLGAVEATPRGVLEHPATQAAVAASYDKAAEAYYDDDSPERAADAVLGLVAATGAEPGEYPWLADLALPGEDGDWYPAGELLLPGSPLAGIVAGDAPFGTVSAGFAERHGDRALAAAGVLATFGLLTVQDVALDESAAELELDGAGEWATAVRDRLRASGTVGDLPGAAGLPGGGRGGDLLGLPPVAAEFTAVRDLDLIDKHRWPQALELLTRPPLRAALTDQVRVLLPGGGHASIPSYTAWWLSRHLVIDGHRPGDLRTPDSDPLLAGLYDVAGVVGAPAAGGRAAGELSGAPSADQVARVLGDPVIARALGVRTSLAGLLAEPGGADELLGRLADPARPVSRAQLRALWSALASAGDLSPEDITPPDLVRVIQGGKVTVADASEALILDAPDLWPIVDGQPLVLVPWPQAARLADLLDLPLASEEFGGGPPPAGQRRPVPDLAREVLAAAPATYEEHDRLLVDGTDIPWRYAGGVLHAATVEGLAHGLAWAAGQWQARHLLAALLLSPDETARLLAEADLELP
ncbi:MAG TPA: hypothetical protein VHV09_06515 [Trebonia sp.]|nr:hypothetical protein [Trebonia sp.]